MAISTTVGKFVKSGDTLDYSVAVNGTAVTVGKFIEASGCKCLALRPIAQGETGALKILHKGEVISVTTNEAIGETSAGTALYLNNGLVTKSANDGASPTPNPYTKLGVAAATITSTALTFDVIVD